MANAKTTKRNRSRQRQRERDREKAELAEKGLTAEQREELAAIDARLGLTPDRSPRKRQYFGGNCLECDRAQWHFDARPRVPMCDTCAAKREGRKRRDRLDRIALDQWKQGRKAR